MTQEKQLGELIWFSRDKGHGIIVRKDAENRLEKFFVHLRNVLICEPALPYSGCWVLFFMVPPKKVTDLPAALNVEVYKTLEAAQAALSKWQAGQAEVQK